MSLNALQEALDRNRIEEARGILAQLHDDERKILRAELGSESYERVFDAVCRSVRDAPRGRVILLHGIMGSDLDVTKSGDRDRVWVNFWRLFNGRIADLHLTEGGRPVDPGVQVHVRGHNRKYYLPALLELDNEWEVFPFAYDWRIDIRRSADKLAEVVRSFGRGKPVHFVAHSMGGLVCRAFISSYRDLWDQCDDSADHERGGRLVMLGTPNHGSYTIPLVLSGKERLVQGLGLLDRTRKLEGLLEILSTFRGVYQMLPSRHVSSRDDRKYLYRKDTWTSYPAVSEEHLADADSFHRSLQEVTDPERFVYVAGTHQKTPSAIRLRDSGEFRYRYTMLGDGRVTHELGALRDVPTFYVKTSHGSLTIDKSVLPALHDLLETGTTERLSQDARVDSGVRSVEEDLDRQGFVQADETLPHDLKVLLEKGHEGAENERTLTEAEERTVESLLLADRGTESDHADRSKDDSHPTKTCGEPTVNIEIIWGDICRSKGDIFSVGHYQGVLPQKAELALDAALSETDDPKGQILRAHTIDGSLRGELGNVNFYPWRPSSQCRTVAVAGMGLPGTFSVQGLRFLVRRLMWAITGLRTQSRAIEVLCSVLIGSGEGTLTIKESVEGFLAGIQEAVDEEDFSDRVGEGKTGSVRPLRIRIVERTRDRAETIHREFSQRLGESASNAIHLVPHLIDGVGGVVTKDDALQRLLKRVEKDGRTEDLFQFLGPKDEQLAEPLQAALEKAIQSENAPAAPRKDLQDPIHILFSKEPAGIRISAISTSATVSERILTFDFGLIDELVQRINKDGQQSVDQYAGFIPRLLLPRTIRQWLSDEPGPFVFVVDRDMAQVHWEMQKFGPDRGVGAFLARRAVVSRQMRTTYSPAPARPRPKSDRLKALVIGDPGDPDKRHDLPGARIEALAVGEILRRNKVEVTQMIGAGNRRDAAKLVDIRPALRLDVLMELLEGQYDIVHYAGHGTFDAEDATRAGWLFADGLLTSKEIARMEEAPLLVVSNACLSGRTALGNRSGKGSENPPESALLPSLADEFFHLGVRNYVGTAWKVNDQGAVLFAEGFYKALLGEGRVIGQAVWEARQELYEKQEFGGLWAAYQHYGDPNAELFG